MNKRLKAVIAAMLVLCLLALGSGSLTEYARSLLGGAETVAYRDMEYQRPDPALMEDVLARAEEAAQAEDLDETVRQINNFYRLYDAYYTNYSLADIRYCSDLTDLYWEAEADYCAENETRVDNALDALYRMLAGSPLRDELEGEDYFGADFFDSYDSPGWDDVLLALMEQEARLESDYFDLCANALEHTYASEEYYDSCAGEMGQLLVELIRVRQQIAAYWGYGDYVQFASDFYHYRDYTVAQTKAYLAEIQQELVPLYRQVNASDLWENNLESVTEPQTYFYVRQMAKNMGGSVEEAFRVMDRCGLYDISPGENKYNASFEVYLTSYGVPFVFVCPEGSSYDFLTLAHEFGHFCNDYASGGSYAGVDVLEVFSQGMEYLSLCYGENTEKLTRLKMADSLFIYVEQAAFASFEMEMYSLEGENLTVENLTALYEKTALAYGFESVGYDPREYVTINHYYTNPMYIISYVVSNDAALQLYAMEKELPGSGLACFGDNLTTEEAYLLAFLESAELESPFGRVGKVKALFLDILG